MQDIVADPERYSASVDTYVVCRLGNDSQLAAEALRSSSQSGSVKDLLGGLVGWAENVDPAFPVY
jgi:adenylyltransferase/sulfurtransferase